MKNNRILLIGVAVILLIVIGLLAIPDMGRHHTSMMGSMTSMSPASTTVMEDDSLEAKAFRQTCTQCHGLPSPGQYTANEWPLIYERMKQHMIESRIAPPDEKAAALILEFLSKHAGQPST